MAAAVSGLRRSGFREMTDGAASLEGALRLELGEPDFPTPAHITEVVARALSSGRVEYAVSRGTPELRALPAAKLRERNGIDVPPERVVVSSGGTQAV